MKLLVCIFCGDVFNLTLDDKTCSCKATSGHYLPDKLTAVVSKTSVVIGFNNNSFLKAFEETDFSSRRGEEFTAFFITHKCANITEKEGE